MAHDGAEHLTIWLKAARQGDQQAFERLCASISSQRCLLAIMTSLPAQLRSKLDPEDILQVALARAWRDIGRLREVSTGGFHRWMAGITRHVVAETVRRFNAEKRNVGREEDVQRSDDSSVFRTDHTPSKSVARREELAQIAALLAELKVSYRAVISCRILEGQTTEQTAQTLDLSPENVRVTLRRALAKFRELLAQRGLESTLLRPI